MPLTDQLAEVAERLGYQGQEGYVAETTTEVGARDYVWRDLREKCQVDAAYFRGAVPLVAFVDVASDDEVRTSQRRLWNFGRIPLLIASTPNEVMAVSCMTIPSLGPGENPALLRSARQGQDVAQVLEEFSRFNIESGKLAAAHPQQFDRRNRVDRTLLDNLRRLRSKLLDCDLSEQQVERLLGRSIFVQYLEDRKILTPQHLEELGGLAYFRDTLLDGPERVRTLFRSLSEHFNGDVFSSVSLNFDIPATALTVLGDFFSGTELRSGQGSFWPYDFSVIPPELISSIYEQLLIKTQKKDAAYYTPRHVVDLVLDELLPWTGDQALPTVLDPACGSGIFLAEAFRRLVYRHTVTNAETPTFDSLSDLLTRSIFGIDQSEIAIGVSAFGLYLALLEHVDPRTAWHDAHLPVLVGRNLVASDFFAEHALSERRFDIVVGNPPWKSALSTAAGTYVSEKRLVIPDRQIAIAFLWHSIDLVDDNGAVGLVMPAKAFLHNRSTTAQLARRRIFSSLRVDTVVDLSPLRRETFGSAIYPACIVIAQHGNEKGPSSTVHVSPRRTPLADAIDGIVVSQDEIREISPAQTTSSALVWKSLLWGSPADFSLVEHLGATFPSLKSVIASRRWDVGQGFQIAGGDHNDARWLVGMDLLPTDTVEAMRIAEHLRLFVEHEEMHRPRHIELFTAPLLVMRKGFNTNPVAAFLDHDVAFPEGLFGISGASEDASDLRTIAALLNSSVARYWYFMTSSSWGVEREQIQLNEYLTLPVPPITEAIQIAAARATELARRSTGEAWLTDLDEAAFDAYRLSEPDRDLIRDGLHMRLEEFQLGSGALSFATPTDDELHQYSELLAKELRSASSLEWAASPVERGGGFSVVACTVDVDGTSTSGQFALLDRLLDQARSSEEWRSPAAVMQPAAIVVEGTAVFLVKADQRRSWTRSAARADAAEVLGAILSASIEQG